MDLVRELGGLALATRLRRLAERLSKEVSAVYQSQAVPIEARWFGVLVLLSRNKAMNVTAIADRLGLTHPAINQVAAVMLRRGVLKQTKVSGDARQRLLSLTPKGKVMMTQITPLLEDIRSANEELIRQTGEDVLAVISKIEDELERESMYNRVFRRVHERQLAAIEIIPFDAKLKRYFKELNCEWLKKYFRVEAHDQKILTHPEAEVIAKGGEILFARLNRRIVGTCAIVPADDRTAELNKMAVAPTERGKQVGRKLALAAIDWGQRHGMTHMTLFTSRRLTAAVGLYKALGFVEVPISKEERERLGRPSIKMSLELRTDRSNRG